MTDRPQHQTANDSMMRGAEEQALDGERPVMEVRLIDGVPYAGDRRTVHDAAQHHPDACSRNPGPNDTATQTLDEMTCPDCLRFIIRLSGMTPYEPPGLRDLIESITYKRGWEFSLAPFVEDGQNRGWRFHVISYTKNSYRPDMDIRVNHAFVVPPASYSRDTWAAWLFDRVRDVETHEAGEFFMLDGYREFAPHHGNGEDPYRVWHVGDHEAARKRAGQD